MASCKCYTKCILSNKNIHIIYFSIHGMLAFYPPLGYLLNWYDKNDIGNNINIPLNDNFGNVEYISISEYILVPIEIKFNSNAIIISAGFDVCINDL